MNNGKTTKDLEYQKELGRLNAEIQLEETMSLASEAMEIYELFEEAERKGDGYGKGFQDGFWAGRELYQKYKTW